MSLADIDREILGREYDRAAYGPVSAAEMIAFASHLGETDPNYLDEEAARKGPYGGLVAHPSFVVKIRGNRVVPDEVMKHMRRGGFDAGKDIEFGVPVRPNDTLAITSTIYDIYEKTGRTGSMYFIVFRTVLTNQNGGMVAIIDSRMMQRGPKR